MKKHLSTVLLIAVFFIGLSVLLYPSVSNYLNQINASHAVVNYDEALNAMSASNYEKWLDEARTYNESLLHHSSVYVDGSPKSEAYSRLLDISGNGMMGYISIKKIGVVLPIYHGTEEEILSIGAGHLEGSSLPIGGESTHAVITGHRGLPSAKLFTDLDQLEIGDTFTITVLDESLVYEVDQIKIVSPYEVDDLGIIPGQDYVTLITCTPYAVNTHRLLVRGIRTDAPHELRVTADAMQIDPVIVAPMVAAPMLLVLLLILLLGSGHRGNKRKSEERKSK